MWCDWTVTESTGTPDRATSVWTGCGWDDWDLAPDLAAYRSLDDLGFLTDEARTRLRARLDPDYDTLDLVGDVFSRGPRWLPTVLGVDPCTFTDALHERLCRKLREVVMPS